VCLAFFAARFSFRLLPGFFMVLFCGDLSDTTVLSHNLGYAHGARDGATGTGHPDGAGNPERKWSDDHEPTLLHARRTRGTGQLICTAEATSHRTTLVGMTTLPNPVNP